MDGGQWCWRISNQDSHYEAWSLRYISYQNPLGQQFDTWNTDTRFRRYFKDGSCWFQSFSCREWGYGNQERKETDWECNSGVKCKIGWRGMMDGPENPGIFIWLYWHKGERKEKFWQWPNLVFLVGWNCLICSKREIIAKTAVKLFSNKTL